MLPISYFSFIVMLFFVAIALIFFAEGDHRRTILLFAGSILALLSIFSLIIPTYIQTQYPQILNASGNVITQSYTIITISNTLSNSVITLYSAFMTLVSLTFIILAIYSLRARVKYANEHRAKLNM